MQRKSSWNKGIPCNEETKQKIREALSGEKNPNYGKKHSPEIRAKISASITGRKLSEETKKKMSEQRKGIPKSEIHKQKIKENHIGMLGKKHSDKTKRKYSKQRKGRKLSEETKKKISDIKKKTQFGKNNPSWKGGISSINLLIRASFLYAEWRQNVFIRDNFTCQKCGSKSNLEAHHIKPLKELLLEVQKYLPLYSLYDGAMIYTPLWDVSNGKTLCKECHRMKRKKN